MGVDSGLPDFRGDKGFWQAYPPFEKLGLNFVDLANPAWFERDPQLAWGFYGHRLHLYRDTIPHKGFDILRQWGRAKNAGYFVFTSNVDGQFQAAEFDEANVVECHGSIHHFQCVRPCSQAIWPAADTQVDIDETTFRASAPLPHCDKCNTLARPNILMFGDGRFVGARTHDQERRMSQWLSQVRGKKLAIVECGAGTAVPTVRWQCERLATAFDSSVIRINPRESQGPNNTVSLPLGAAEALRRLDDLLTAKR
ncbi:NAD-dependent protein deacetylase [Persicimonas caeni]|uniref:protein acetyllysine N-acetyltransferase n=2 Tax=Persicimonas caeni TaxID=2292766 RepID=A0A4Y6Q336_PERCE|nr:NAD-dependent protein deacetylase [Persicimonas caeni]QED36188.1 NAD-dependent protein deacetylase [Persicimonas caeni]